MYLLDTLKSRGLTWPKLWWRPEIDGGVCSYLGSVDETFDAHATLTTLEAKEEEERLRATAAKINPQVKTRFDVVEAKVGKKLSVEEMEALLVKLTEKTDGAGGGQMPMASGTPGESSSK